jgi:hypothetical protein
MQPMQIKAGGYYTETSYFHVLSNSAFITTHPIIRCVIATITDIAKLQTKKRTHFYTYYECRGKVLFLWLYSPILGLGRLHETFNFISVTRSRTVGRTPLDGWSARHKASADDGEVGGMNGFGRGNRSTRRKPVPTPLCPPQIPLARPRREPGPPRWEPSDWPLQLWRGRGKFISGNSEPYHEDVLRRGSIPPPFLTLARNGG